MDSVILESPGGVPRALVKCQNPLSCIRETEPDELDMWSHVGHPIGYAVEVMMEHPEVSVLPLILTNGRDFTVGYGKRDSLASVVFVLCETQFSLYVDEKTGPDFGLFWSMCNYAGPKCSLDLVVQKDPAVAVRVSKCIVNGALTFIYEASLVPDPEGSGASSPLYGKLEALERFVVKIPKSCASGTAEAWQTEMEALDRLIEKGAQDCCLLPIHRGTAAEPFRIYPLGAPVVSTTGFKLGRRGVLENVHFAGLLKDVCAIHQAGLVHRDIQQTGVLLVGDAAKLVDLSYTMAPTTSRRLAGTQVTASQAVLKAVLRNRPIHYRPEDDLESMTKGYLIGSTAAKTGYGGGMVGGGGRERLRQMGRTNVHMRGRAAHLRRDACEPAASLYHQRRALGD